jgi:hypothetical protein
MGLIMVICGTAMAITSFAALAMPAIRNLESILPDYAPVAVEKSPTEEEVFEEVEIASAGV